MRVEILSMCHEWVMIFNICNGIGLSLSWSFTIKSILFIYTIVSSIVIKSLACNGASYNDCVKTYPAAKAFVHIISFFLYGFYLNKMDVTKVECSLTKVQIIFAGTKLCLYNTYGCESSMNL